MPEVAVPPSRIEDRYADLFEKLRGPAKAMVRRAFGSGFSDDQLEDLYSSAWVSTLGALKRKPRRLDDDELRRYLMTAVANQASREMRRRGRKPTLPIELAHAAADPGAAPEEAAAVAEKSQMARDILGSLPPRRRAVMVFRYAWGLEPDEVRSLVGGLSPRAYRKEVERGVAEVARKLRMVEDGRWCESREGLLRSVAAGTAAEEEQLQARRHLRHCRSCAGFLGSLQGQLHDLGGSIALLGGSGVVERSGLAERAFAAADRGRELVSSAFGRGPEAAGENMAQAMAAGGTRGAGVAGAGAVAKLAGLGAIPKVVAACVGTGAAATACVAAGVLPGVELGQGPERPPAQERPADGAGAELERPVAALSAVAPPDPGTAAAADGPAPPPQDRPAPDAGQPTDAEAPPPQDAPQAPAPSPTAQEFEPVGAPAEPASSPVPTESAIPAGGETSGSSSRAASSGAGGDFGP
jgi:DNA-directed RNA polymerase specialized sigma24 family protein